MLQIGPYWINPQHIVYCHDQPDLPQPTISVYLRYVGGDMGTCLTLEAQDREAMLAWLQQHRSTLAAATP
jgi:hypothetical protein